MIESSNRAKGFFRELQAVELQQSRLGEWTHEGMKT